MSPGPSVTTVLMSARGCFKSLVLKSGEYESAPPPSRTFSYDKKEDNLFKAELKWFALSVLTTLSGALIVGQLIMIPIFAIGDVEPTWSWTLLLLIAMCAGLSVKSLMSDQRAQELAQELEQARMALETREAELNESGTSDESESDASVEVDAITGSDGSTVHVHHYGAPCTCPCHQIPGSPQAEPDWAVRWAAHAEVVAAADSDRENALREMCVQVRSGAAQLLDVREEYEHADGYLAAAVRYPLSRLVRGDEPPAGYSAGLDTYLHCARGIRVHSAVGILREKHVGTLLVPLQEGFDTLVEFGRSEGGKAAETLAVSYPPSSRDSASEDARDSALLQVLQTSRDYAHYREVRARSTPLIHLWQAPTSHFSHAPQVRVLGTGSSGSAVLLEDPSRRRKVVAKCMNVDAGLDDMYLMNMEREVKLLQQLTHANVIGYLGTVFASKSMHILMEYAPGGSVKQLMSAAATAFRPFDSRRVCRWTRELALGLQYIHHHGVVHRDLKPDNLLLGCNDDIKIADFGWSTALAPAQMATTMAGTPYYMAPEVLQRKQYGMPADLWAVGVVLHELLTLTRPFTARSIGELERMVSTQPVKLEPFLCMTTHPIEVCSLATSECLLHVDAHKRMTLRELIAVLDLVPELSGPISTPPVESEPMGTSSDESVIPSTNRSGTPTTNRSDPKIRAIRRAKSVL